jgi:hypothetical protein
MSLSDVQRNCAVILSFLVVWIGLAFAVAIAANTRGRSGGAWFFLAILLSPLVAGVIVLAMPSLVVTATERAAQPFQPQGVLNGIPYRILPQGQVEAMLPGGRTVFRNLDTLAAVAKGETIEYEAPDAKTLAEYPDELNGFRYKQGKNGRVKVLTPNGEQVEFPTWTTFWNEANRR